MAGASDRARFYLEKSIPDLHELERKKIFSKEEITKIASKRSDFEHKLNVRGSIPADFLRYVEYEKNLDDLRRKRAKRLGARGKGHVGSMRILSIYNRATRKFPGDLSLWTEYLDYAKKQHAYKTVVEILTKMVRLHPTNPDIWIYAANSAFDENGDMTEARSYMQRGLRFCKTSKKLWLAYARLEISYLSKLARRRRVLGLDDTEQAEHVPDKGPDADADRIALPVVTAEDPNPGLASELAPGSSDQNHKAPALRGAIPIAIFDAALQHFKNVKFAGQIFDLTSEFPGIPATKDIASHVLQKMKDMDSTSATTLDCFVREPLVGVEPNSPEFPAGVRESVKRLKSANKEAPSLDLAMKTVAWTTSYLKRDLDPDIRVVLVKIAISAMDCYRSIHDDHGSGSGDDFAGMLRRLEINNLKERTESVLSWARSAWPESKAFKLRQEVLTTEDSQA